MRYLVDKAFHSAGKVDQCSRCSFDANCILLLFWKSNGNDFSFEGTLCFGNENILDVETYIISACWESSVAIYGKNKTQENLKTKQTKKQQVKELPSIKWINRT